MYSIKEIVERNNYIGYIHFVFRKVDIQNVIDKIYFEVDKLELDEDTKSIKSQHPEFMLEMDIKCTDKFKDSDDTIDNNEKAVLSDVIKRIIEEATRYNLDDIIIDNNNLLLRELLHSNTIMIQVYGRGLKVEDRLELAEFDGKFKEIKLISSEWEYKYHPNDDEADYDIVEDMVKCVTDTYNELIIKTIKEKGKINGQVS